MNGTLTRSSDETPATQTDPAPPPTPASAGTATGPGEPLTGITLSPFWALAYAALIIVFNIGLSAAAASVPVQQGLRVFIVSVGGPRLANRELLAAVLSGVLVVVGYAILLAPAVLLARSRGLRFSDAFGLRRLSAGQTVLLVLGVVFGGIFLSIVFGLLLRAFGIQAPNNTVQLVRGFGSGPEAMAIGYLIVGVVAPFAEEVTFRGIVFSGLRARWGTSAGMIVSGLLFGIVHLVPLETLPLALIGILLASVFLRSRSLWVSIIAHGCYNVAVLTAAFASAGLLR